jgi:hypothetical protein
VTTGGPVEIKRALVKELDEVACSKNPELTLLDATRSADFRCIDVGHSDLDALIPEGISINDAVGSNSVAAFEPGASA